MPGVGVAEPADKVVVVTGGSGGIGAACVRALARSGFSVLFTYNKGIDSAARLEAELTQQGFRVAAEPCDLQVVDDIERLCGRISSYSDAPYGLVLSAGEARDGLASVTRLTDAHAVFQTNFFSNVQIVKSLLRPMARARTGRVVLVGSVAATLGSRGNGIYAATKGALRSYARCLIDEVSRRGVTVNCVEPGFIRTEMIAGYGERVRELENRIPSRRLGEPEDVASVVEFLMTPAAAYVNGAFLSVDGGLSAVVGSGLA